MCQACRVVKRSWQRAYRIDTRGTLRDDRIRQAGRQARGQSVRPTGRQKEALVGTDSARHLFRPVDFSAI
jgi:hypothetical protein